MGAAKVLEWVDRRVADCVVGWHRRSYEIHRVAPTEITIMTRSIADWLYRYRWWPWVITALLLPLQLWPASWWLDVRSVNIRSAPVGEPLLMMVERTVKRDFRGSWNVTLRRWDGNGWVTWCNATGRTNYRNEATLPKNLALQWWTDGACHPLPVGRYKTSTSWSIESPSFMPNKTTVAESNVFEVLP